MSTSCDKYGIGDSLINLGHVYKFIRRHLKRERIIKNLKRNGIEKKEGSKTQYWEWEETPELLVAIENLQKSSQAVKDATYKPRPIRSGNTNYAPLKGKKNDK